jgi:hypothetical protein
VDYIALSYVRYGLGIAHNGCLRYWNVYLS